MHLLHGIFLQNIMEGRNNGSGCTNYRRDSKVVWSVLKGNNNKNYGISASAS